MPAVSRKQQRFMAMCRHNPENAKGKCPSKEVAKEFSHIKLSAVKTRARKKGLPVRPGHPEDDKRYVKYY